MPCPLVNGNRNAASASWAQAQLDCSGSLNNTWPVRSPALRRRLLVASVPCTGPAASDTPHERTLHNRHQRSDAAAPEPVRFELTKYFDKLPGQLCNTDVQALRSRLPPRGCTHTRCAQCRAVPSREGAYQEVRGPLCRVRVSAFVLFTVHRRCDGARQRWRRVRGRSGDAAKRRHRQPAPHWHGASAPSRGCPLPPHLPFSSRCSRHSCCQARTRGRATS